MRLKDSSVQAVLSSASIVDVVSGYTSLRKRGATYSGLCPFHQEKTPSFTVSADKGLYYCFGCGEGGDVVRFVERIENLSFMEAIEQLGDRFGVPVEYEEGAGTDPGRKDKESRLLLALDRAAAFYQRFLWESTDGGAAREYLEQRGLAREVCQAFRVGLSPAEWRGLQRRAAKEGFSDKELEEAGLLVRQTSFAWSVGDLAHVLFLRYVVRAEGAALQDAWVGLWTELASGFRDDYSCWPPSTSCSTTGGWFKKKWVQYDDSLRLLREHYCAGQPVPGGCNLAHVPCWVGVRLLGVSPGSLSDPDQHVTLAAWSWSAGSPYRDEDVERYALLSSGLVSPLLGDSLLPFTGDPVELLAAGPFQVASGDSVTVDFALVGGAEVADLQQHARTAQQFYDAGFDLTVPVRASLVSADAGDGRVRLVWYVAEGREDWTVLRGRDGAAWGPIGTVSPDGAGYVRFEDAGAAPGVRWGYRLRAPEGDTYGEAWVDVPPAATLALQGARPNPAVRGGLRVAFTLAERGPVRIEIFDPAGRRVLTRDLGDLPPGPHEVDLARPAGTRPGTCFIRLRQGNGTRTARAVLLE